MNKLNKGSSGYGGVVMIVRLLIVLYIEPTPPQPDPKSKDYKKNNMPKQLLYKEIQSTTSINKETMVRTNTRAL